MVSPVYNEPMKYSVLIFTAIFGALVLTISCAQKGKSKDKTAVASEDEELTLKLHIGDGRVFIEKSHSHDLINGRNMAATTHNNNFMATEKSFLGNSWVDEGSEFTLDESKQPSCNVAVRKSHFNLGKRGRLPSYSVKVNIVDGIKEAPFEFVINGENEGEIQFGDYPVKTWRSANDLRLDETFISRWSYDAKERTYKIVKKMGEDSFLSKEVRIDHQLRDVAGVKYEILRGQEGEDPAEMPVKARFSCGF